jgi:hypothetical protein
VAFGQYETILAENPEEVKPILFRYLQEIMPVPRIWSNYYASDFSFDIINSILWTKFYKEEKLLTKEEEKKLVRLYQEKTHWYFEKYKIVDAWVTLLEMSIIAAETGENIALKKKGTRRI